MSRFHTPVMVREVISVLNVKPEGIYVDATLGGGGHTKELLKAGANVLGLDRDQEALEAADKDLKGIKKGSVKVVRGNFSDIEKIALGLGFNRVDGIIFDLGLSSHQVDTAFRGFSYRYGNSDIDLRFNQNQGVPAWEVINSLDRENLYEVLAKYSEEKYSRSIADAIFRSRSLKEIRTMGDLVCIVKDNVKGDWKKSAARVLQAWRIYINRELEELRKALTGAGNILRPGGVISVISYHSLEDRMVKLEFMKPSWIRLNKKPLRPAAGEIRLNSRARSAKMRNAKKV